MPSRDPQRVVKGRGSLAGLGAELDALGAGGVLVVSSPSRRFVATALASLGDRQHALFDGAQVHVPRAVVDRAAEALRAAAADAIVAIGGGSATGLGKALRLRADVRFVAVPTTFSGSERTSLWGTTEAGEKRTGRDPRVRPDVVIYDAVLFEGMPPRAAIPSVLNALAHPISALSTGELEADARAAALFVVAALLPALARFADGARDAAVLDALLEGAAAAGDVIERGRFGAHHAAAHALGGRFGLEHAVLHGVLLPRFFASLPAALREEIGRAAGVADPAAVMLAALAKSGAPTSLRELGLRESEVEAALATRPELGGDAGSFVRAALGDAP